MAAELINIRIRVEKYAFRVLLADRFDRVGNYVDEIMHRLPAGP